MTEPRGVAWRLTAPLTGGSRSRRYELFMELLQPTAESSILDVGVTDREWRSANFLESRYPWPHNITAVAPEPVPAFAVAHPLVTVVRADGRALPFRDGQFDVGFSNAVIEHVGSRADQGRFIAEMLRTCRRVFIATPNRRFPVDPHTLLPFVHWLPRRPRERVLRLTGNARWASQEMLNPLGAGEFLALFPSAAQPRLIRQRILGMTSVLIALAGEAPPRD